MTVNLKHIFPDSGNDINLYWAHLRTTDNASYPIRAGSPPETQMSGPDWTIGPDANTTRKTSGQVKYSYDVFNAEIGKHVNFDPNLKTRFFSGISGIWLQKQANAYFAGSNPFTFNTLNQSRYNGAGIRLGLDGEYQGKYAINAVGLLAGNIFIGSQQPLTQMLGTSDILARSEIQVNHQFISHASYIQVIPALDAKLGLKFSRESSNDKSFTIEGGYMASVYVNAIQNYVASTYVPGTQGIVTGSVFLQSLMKTTESFSVDGPYIQASFKM